MASKPGEDDKDIHEKSEENTSSSNPPQRPSTETNVRGTSAAPISTKQAGPKPVSFFRLFRFATITEKALNCVGLLAAVGAGAAQPLMSLIFGRLVQDFIRFQQNATAVLQNNTPEAEASLALAAAQFRHTAAQDAMYLTFIGIGMFVCTWTYMMTWVYTGEVGAKRLREKYLESVLRQDIAFFDAVGAGEVTTRIQTDTHLVQQGISEKVALVVTFASSFVTGFVLAYIRSWRLALALSSIMPCIAITGSFMNKFAAKYMQQALKHGANSGTIAEEVISTVRTAQAFGTQNTLGDLYDTHLYKARTADLKAAAWHGGGLAVFFFVLYAAYGLAFNFGTTLINRGEATAGIVINVFLAVIIGSFALALAGPEVQAIIQARSAAAKLYETIERVPTIDSLSSSGLKPEKCVGDITLTDISFSYPSRPTVPILKNLSMSFPAGKAVALVGPSGSGKSTVVNLVERFYDPLKGSVHLDGIDVRELNVKWLRSQIGLVSQEPILFAASIKDNVAHGLIGSPHENISDEEKLRLVKEACIKANADGFISKLPMGYDTLVGERGFLLSGGQKQRVAIARAIVSDPRILLLDEATSALDTQSEGVVQDALDKAAAGRTTITIAHRLSTIKHADCIHVMGDGSILESGTHAELLSRPDSLYARLVRAQELRDMADVDASSAGTVSSAPLNRDSQYSDALDMEKQVAEEIPLGRRNTGLSLASAQLAEKEAKEMDERFKSKEYSLTYLFRRMAKINSSSRNQYILSLIAACMTGSIWPAFGIVYGKGITGLGDLDPHQRRFLGDRNALWLFIIALIAFATIAIQNFLFGASAAELNTKLRSLSFRAILRQDIEFFDKEENSTGQLTSNLSENPQKVNGLAGVTLGAIVQALSTIITGAIIGLIFAWRLGLVGIACAPVLASAGYIRLRVVILKDQQNKKAHEHSAQIACEAAAAIRTVASLTREEDCCKMYSATLEEPLRNSNHTARWSNTIYALSQSMSFWVISLVFWYGSRLVSEQKVTTFHFFVALMSTTFGAMQAGNVFRFVPDMSSAKGAASDILTLLDSVPLIDSESRGGVVPESSTIQGRIRFQDVHFRYPTRPGVPVLRGLNLTVEPGTYVALVGASGCGKSTTIQLIERFYDPLSGSLYLDDHRVSELNVAEYRKHLALVSQEPTLYSGTIRFNILLGATKPASEVTQKELEEACRSANILDFIESLPNGFETEVGGKGSQLSGGQKQRIAIARALLRNPKVLLLDEATSALDSNSEKVVQEALDRAAKGRTTIAIAHRLSTIQNADHIYFLKDGVVSESGTHDQLLAMKGGYAEFVQMQALNRA
ncbi:P-loop containing nucleoside triphosphate hydrolase protein [Cristinia sonorae]|uniref:P-loop containing nucleoside triphosphate hydrolase protein n=1 Tax=Cristinia sonorae TaxID=1940300 RepID=A0A8K0UFW4_9AGAR|nr:P-loop containing nucleoside triphosphate hydrolase protein [Cristinia sonorae]